MVFVSDHNKKLKYKGASVCSTDFFIGLILVDEFNDLMVFIFHT